MVITSNWAYPLLRFNVYILYFVPWELCGLVSPVARNALVEPTCDNIRHHMSDQCELSRSLSRCSPAGWLQFYTIWMNQPARTQLTCAQTDSHLSPRSVCTSGISNIKCHIFTRITCTTNWQILTIIESSDSWMWVVCEFCPECSIALCAVPWCMTDVIAVFAPYCQKQG